MNYGQIDVADSDEGIHGLILDSKWFRDFFAQSDLILAYRVVVIGPYVDDFSRASFTPNLQYTYIAYSELESKLVPLLESMMASFHHLDRE
ncbi:hypothetical protein [Vibrio hippocampi]|uniref:hypothetical protein n=1 Tax=Vibrio hippocampi TaxID=654686 RepID=UPI001F3FA30D|nr:hypothetical protein [Vibrio hippocampi]